MYAFFWLRCNYLITITMITSAITGNYKRGDQLHCFLIYNARLPRVIVLFFAWTDFYWTKYQHHPSCCQTSDFIFQWFLIFSVCMHWLSEHFIDFIKNRHWFMNYEGDTYFVNYYVLFILRGFYCIIGGSAMIMQMLCQLHW